MKRMGLRMESGAPRRHLWFNACSAGVISFLLSIASTPAHAARTGTMGGDSTFFGPGTPATATCPNKTYLAGFTVWYDSFSGLSPYCVAMAADGTWAGGAQIHLDIMMSEVVGDGSRRDMFCPRDFYMFGFRGSTHVYGLNSITQLTVTCKNVKAGAVTTFSTPYPSGVSVTEWRGAQCTDDSVADGVFGYVHDARIIQFGLSCAQTQPAILAQARARQLLQGAAQSQATSYSASLSPSVLSPVVGQRFYNQSPVAIKLAMPKGWIVSSYLVKLQRKDSTGKWLDHANLPVGAAEAQSPAGYTGFGAGAPPAFLSLPGSWRLAAQASYPKQSGWSDWREFFVVTALHPTANTRVKR